MAKKEKNVRAKDLAPATTMAYTAPRVDYSTSAQHKASRAGLIARIEWAEKNSGRYIRVIAERDTHVKPRSRRGWPDGGKAVRKLADTRAEQAIKATKDAKAQQRQLNRIPYLTDRVRNVQDPLGVLAELGAGPALSAKVMEAITQ